jgi:hypothetical protein
MRHRIIVSLVALCCCIPAGAHAGRLFGDIRMAGKPLPAGIPVTIARAPAADEKGKASPPMADSTATDAYGAYKLSVKEEGKCVLSIQYEKKTVSLEVFSYKEATRYDLVLEKKDGALSLRRK